MSLGEVTVLSGDPPLQEGVCDMRSVLDVVEGLAGDERRGLGDAGSIAGLGRRLVTAGFPLDWPTLHLRTLHPETLGARSRGFGRTA